MLVLIFDRATYYLKTFSISTPNEMDKYFILKCDTFGWSNVVKSICCDLGFFQTHVNLEWNHAWQNWDTQGNLELEDNEELTRLTLMLSAIHVRSRFIKGENWLALPNVISTLYSSVVWVQLPEVFVICKEFWVTTDLNPFSYGKISVWQRSTCVIGPLSQKFLIALFVLDLSLSF